MADNSVQYVLLAVLSVIHRLGLAVNLIIVVANYMKWKSLKSLQTCDKILSCLAISRALYFIALALWNFLSHFSSWLLQNNIMFSILSILTMYIFYSSHWIAAILCVFYCAKIVTYNYKLFVFLKTRISTMVPWLILASLVISLISVLPFAWYGYDSQIQHVLNGSTENVTDYGLLIVQNFDNQFLMFSVGSFPAFLIFCLANLLLIHFLLMHTRRMRGNGSHIQSPNLESHFSALKSMSLFLVLQIMLVICMSLSISGQFFNFTLQILIVRLLLCSPPFLHSLYMISSSKEVKKILILMCLGIFRCS